MTSSVRICHNKYHLNALRFLSEGCVMIKNNYVTQHCLKRNAGLIVRRGDELGQEAIAKISKSDFAERQLPYASLVQRPDRHKQTGELFLFL